MNKLTASYLAGLLDGEGSFELFKRKNSGCKIGYFISARIRITLVEKELIEWLKKSFGGWISTRGSHGNNRTSYEWCLANQKIYPFLMKVLPYLKIKKPQAEILRKFLKTKDSNSYVIKTNKLGYGIGKHKELKQDVVEFREQLFEEIRELNKRGLHAERLSAVPSKDDATV